MVPSSPNGRVGMKLPDVKPGRLEALVPRQKAALQMEGGLQLPGESVDQESISLPLRAGLPGL